MGVPKIKDGSFENQVDCQHRDYVWHHVTSDYKKNDSDETEYCFERIEFIESSQSNPPSKNEMVYPLKICKSRGIQLKQSIALFLLNVNFLQAYISEEYGIIDESLIKRVPLAENFFRNRILILGVCAHYVSRFFDRRPHLKAFL